MADPGSSDAPRAEREHAFLHALAAEPEGPAEPTSVRLPAHLREAMKLAKELGYDVGFAAASEAMLRSILSDIAQDLVFATFDAVAPHSAPTLGQLAWAAALLEGDPLAEQRDLLDAVAEQVLALKPDADGDDVVLAARVLQQSATL